MHAVNAFFRSPRLGLLALATSACLAQAQSLSIPSPTKNMTTQAPNTLAFFYQQPVVLDRQQHKNLRFAPADARFAAKSQAVPLLASEFPEACLEYPIVFAKGQDGRWLSLAVTGLQAQVNAFVDAKGQWTGRYVPASVRRYPFILAESEGDKLSLAVDLAAPHFAGQGEPLFNEQGEPSELVNKVMPMLADFQGQALQTSAMAKDFEDAGLLTQQNMQVRLGDGREATVEGVWVVDEAKLRQLPDDKVLAWFKGGQMAVLHAHMLSLRQLVPLLERSQIPVPAAAKPETEPKKADAPKAKAR